MTAIACSASPSPRCRATILNTSVRQIVGTINDSVSSIADANDTAPRLIREVSQPRRGVYNIEHPASHLLSPARVSLDSCVDAPQKPAHTLGCSHRNQLDSVFERDGLNSLSRLDVKLFPDCKRNYDLELRADGYRVHSRLISGNTIITIT